ncbi:EAL domain-containing protein [Neiella sp. HB171785]|uniref:EAL domain-containing protein n=2 Tax=Neiella litorisoli TaxID=2771431 RepID=A0A8J6QVF9_9GAMM|nr:EAL domain-containing protein [Neiella litorisoli]
MLQQRLNECIQAGSGYTLEYRLQHEQGHWVWFEDSGKVVELSDHSNNHANDDVQRICGTLKNINNRKQAELEYRENERRFRRLIEALPTVAVQGYNRNREVIYWNDASRRVYGYSKQEALGQKLEHLIIPEPMREAVVQAHHEWVVEGKEIPASELSLLHKDGHLVPVFSSHVMLKQDSDQPEMFCVDVDLTDQHRTAAELKRLASKDLLTNLPNRRFLEEELHRRLAEASRFGQQLAVLFIDLDLFKDVNDSMGHNAGDHLLQQVADRLKSHLRHYDTLSRFGGDEFIIVLPNIAGRNEIQTVADKVMSEFEQTYRLYEQDIYVTASIGISMYPDDGETTAELLKYADAAMYQAKESGRNRYRFFAASMNEQLNRQRQIATSLRQSLDGDDFHLVFQPQIDLASQHIVACEALLRWQPKEASNWASPAEFIPVAERSDLIIRIGQWVVQAACRQVAKWRSQQLLPIRVDINVSGKQLHQPGFFNFLNDTIAEYGLTPKDIGIELTENVLIGADDDLLRRLTQLHDAGMEISIDDFGTGYSSLSYLKLFPVRTLKIDRMFVEEAPYQQKDRAIFEAIVNVGHKLGLNIVVEGIETEQQTLFCQQLHYDLAQGYYFYKPMPASQLADLLTRSEPN